MRNASLVAVFAVAMSSLVAAQPTVVYFPDNVVGGSGQNTFPFNTQAAVGSLGFTTLNVYPGAALAAAGVPAGATLSQLAILNGGGASGAATMTIGTCKVLVGSMAYAPQPPPALAYTHNSITAPAPPFFPSEIGWGGNMTVAVPYWDTAIDGPFVVPWTSGTFTPLPRSAISPAYMWDGVSDVVVMITHSNGLVNGFSVTSMLTPAAPLAGYLRYARHGANNTFNPATGTFPTTSGVFVPKMAMTFASELGFSCTTTGGGVGDLSMSLLGMMNPLCTEGYTLVSSSATGPVGAGPLLGLDPDATTFGFLQQPLGVGDPLHWVANAAGVWPTTPFTLPAGVLAGLAGSTWDAVCIAFGPGFTPVQITGVQRLVW